MPENESTPRTMWTAGGVSIAAILLPMLVSFLLGRCDLPKENDPGKKEPASVQQPTPAIPEFKDEPGGIPPMGYEPDPSGTKTFLRSLDKPTIREAGPDLFDDAKADEPVLLYRALLSAYQKTYSTPWTTPRQEIGDCVSHGWAHGIAIALAVDFELGNVGEWKFPASEAIYGGARVEGAGKKYYGGGDGSYGGAAARWVHEKGGVLFRQPYEKFDLTKYSGKRAKEWGAYGCGGKQDDGAADDLAREHPVLKVALVRNFEEAAAAIKSGYPIPVCSGQGFRSARDKDGFAAPSGSWSHCMCFVAVRFDRPGLLCLNSWGESWISGPVWPEDQIAGSFWVDKSTVNSMLRGEDSFAVSAADGFPLREFNNADWLSSAPTVHRKNPPSTLADSPQTEFALAP